MKKNLKCLLLLTVVMIMACITITAEAASGAWRKDADGTWSYYENGELLTNRWVGNYYVGADGKRVTNQWIDGYFVGENGKYIKNFAGGLYKIGGKWYCYTAAGEKRTGWIHEKNKWYYADENGECLTQWQTIDGATYYFNKSKANLLTGMQKLGGKYYYFSKNSSPKGQQIFGWYTSTAGNKYYFDPETGERMTSWQTIDGNRYWFTKEGVMITGWKRITGKKYFFGTDGAMYVGLQKIGAYYYYFSEEEKTLGRLQTDTVISVNEKTYTVDSNGICQEEKSVSDDMIFFTVYESGSSASSLIGYAQTGGDSGNACGKYQFDYRYALLPFIKYCYSANPTAFAEFKTFARYTDSERSKLKGNTKLYSAWKTIYNRDPELFKDYQDSFAKEQYYDTTASYLLSYFGINMEGRPDVVKGAVFSYAIQHGSYSAALAVKNAGIKNSTSNKQFINKLYAYRVSQYPAYASRYTSEKRQALSLL